MPYLNSIISGNQLSKDGHNLLLLPYEPEELNDCAPEYKQIALDHRHLYSEYAVINAGTSLTPLFLILFKKQTTTDDEFEYLRRCSNTLFQKLEDLKCSELKCFFHASEKHVYAFIEGLFLSSYKFERYFRKHNNPSKDLRISIDDSLFGLCKHIPLLSKSVALAKDWVNEPANQMDTVAVVEACEKLANELDFEIEVLNKKKIESLKMGGLMAVNAGSSKSPAFVVMRYKNVDALNQKPIVLIGKGVTYDTGGLSLKPTPNSMDQMKSDLAGAAVVAATMQYLASVKLPIDLFVLLPITDNRLSSTSIAPGDVIEMADQTTVEVVNTDAEGRLILADALIYASRFDPEIVIDMATLTGSAARAIGREAMVMMGTASENTKNSFKTIGYEVGERVVEFPLWNDYAQQIKSSVADLKNLGGDEAGAITAGKFLQHFVRYPWLHFDIAGVAFSKTAFYHHGEGATGIGVRLLVSFLSHYIKTYGTTGTEN